MKARIKATGEIVDVVFESSYVKDGVKVSLWTDGKKEYSKDSLDFIDTDMPSDRRMRYELVKAVVPTIYKMLYGKLSNENIVKDTLEIIDEVIKQLKESEAKK
jgi:hypothetical protein